MLTGVLHLSRLRALGVDPRAAVRNGTLTRLRPGWFAAADARADQQQAVLHAGFVSCVSFFDARGAYRPEDDRLHLGVHSSNRARTTDPGVVVHWSRRIPMPTGPAVVASTERALEHLLLCQPSDESVAVVDSALHRGIIGPGLLAGTMALLPARLHPLLSAFDGRAESGIESLTRFRLLACGVGCRPQAEIPGVGRVDLLIDDWLVIELDGRRWHTAAEAFTRDRRRDAAAVLSGYTVLRFSYADVVHDWARTSTVILGTMARGRTR
ncbi:MULTISPECIES: endonuclease domain-containing protein [unclassified Rathayibacter]|uniref:endonuclease domain-containing protein n=1 Tax=unclassified Rathayibacter TaxID=2609250 RepID=UPI000CE8B6D6|nr:MULTISPECIES: DUF559 domain-containing protein [unclassified Rathayibacter]PPI25626.1 hypothetical protein C5D08_00635 [Rathayibacter sp. AY1B6]PPI26250.1 hypothetical protein C5D44_08280 [Rathayibacter sp. AY1B5]PPI32340.1 hypothetical protein C5D34_11700 [Rathayibacter sp. AY1B1]